MPDAQMWVPPVHGNCVGIWDGANDVGLGVGLAVGNCVGLTVGASVGATEVCDVWRYVQAHA